MRRLILLTFVLILPFPSGGQNTKKMNSIKKSSQYLYAEATMETADEAYQIANDLLLLQVKEYAQDKKAFHDKDILIRNIQGRQDSLQIPRGDMVKVFLYVKKNDILDVDNVVLLENPSVEKKEENIVVPEKVKHKVSAADMALKLPLAWQQDVIDQLLSAGSYTEARALLSRLKAEFKIKKTGPMNECKSLSEVFLLIGKNGQVTTVLGPGSTTRTDFKAMNKTSDTYDTYEKVWFTLSK